MESMGLFLSAMEPDVAVQQDIDNTQCILGTLQGNMLPKFSDSAIRRVIDKKLEDGVEGAKFEFTIERGGQFSLFFANCEDDTPVSFEIRVEMFNFNSGGKDYLSVGETELDVVFWVRARPLRRTARDRMGVW